MCIYYRKEGIVNTEYLLHYFKKYQNGELTLGQIAQQMNTSEQAVKAQFESLSGLAGTRQTLNG